MYVAIATAGDGFMDHLVQMNQLYALIVEEREK